MIISIERSNKLSKLLDLIDIIELLDHIYSLL